MKMDKHGGNIYRYDRPMIDFSANLNPAGMPAQIKQAVIGCLDRCEAYPDPHQTDLKRALAEYHRTSPSRICCGNGAADIIFRIALALRPKRALIIEPAFSEYRDALELSGCSIEEHILREEDGFHLDGSVLETVGRTRPEMVFLCTPANPTGIIADRELVLMLADRCAQSGARLVLDECFMEFVLREEDHSVMDRIDSLPNVIILKSFTKYFAMAGIRLGYCVCGNEADAEKIAGCMQAWPVATTASAAGIAALQCLDDQEEIKAFIVRERQKLMDGLKKLGCRVFDSQANYVFFRSPVLLDEPLIEHGIMIRNCSNYAGLGDGYYRAAVRTEQENRIFLEALRGIFEEAGGTGDGN